MDPFTAGLMKAAWVPMVASMRRVRPQRPVAMPTAPAAMAATSAALAATTTLRLGKRSAAHPAGAAKTR